MTCLSLYITWIDFTLITCSEGHDRTDIGLPGKQNDMITTIKGAISSTMPMIVVLMSGGPVDLTTAKVNYCPVDNN